MRQNNGQQEGGTFATEVCAHCGRIAKTSVGYRNTEPSKRGNWNIDNVQNIDAEQCTKEKIKWDVKFDE